MQESQVTLEPLYQMPIPALDLVFQFAFLNKRSHTLENMTIMFPEIWIIGRHVNEELGVKQKQREKF